MCNSNSFELLLRECGCSCSCVVFGKADFMRLCVCAKFKRRLSFVWLCKKARSRLKYSFLCPTERVIIFFFSFLLTLFFNPQNVWFQFGSYASFNADKSTLSQRTQQIFWLIRKCKQPTATHFNNQMWFFAPAFVNGKIQEIKLKPQEVCLIWKWS